MTGAAANGVCGASAESSTQDVIETVRLRAFAPPSSSLHRRWVVGFAWGMNNPASKFVFSGQLVGGVAKPCFRKTTPQSRVSTRLNLVQHMGESIEKRGYRDNPYLRGTMDVPACHLAVRRQASTDHHGESCRPARQPHTPRRRPDCVGPPRAKCHYPSEALLGLK